MRSSLRALIGSFLVAVLSISAYGQATSRGDVTGVIQDSAGAVIPGASVTLTRAATGEVRTTQSNEVGSYSFPLLEVGEYKLEVRAAGFQTQLRAGVRVETQSTSVVNFTLEVGEMTQTVEVVAREEVLKTETVELGGLVEGKKVLALPQNTRTWTNLTRLEPGTVDHEIVTAQSGPTTGGGAFAQGVRVFFNSMYVDGIDLNDPNFPGSAVITQFTGGTVSNEAIQEFNVVTGNAGANFGINMGAQMNVTTKRGTNEWHGTVFEFLRNNKLDARNFFDAEEAQRFRLNQFGVSAGGPLWPHKLFFFGNYEGYRQRKRETRIAFVPTPLLLSQVPGGAAFGFLQEALDALYPDPTPGTFGPTDLVAPLQSFRNFDTSRDMFLVRSDFELSSRQTLTARYLVNNSPSGLGSAVGTGIPSSDAAALIRVRNALLGHTFLISPTRVNEFRFGYNRLKIFAPDRPTPQELLALGFGPNAFDPTAPPFIFPAGTGLTFTGQIPQVTFGRSNNTFQFSDVFSQVHGKHNFKAGFDVLRIQSNQFNDLFIRPQVIFFGFGPGVGSPSFEGSPFGLTTGIFFAQQQNFFQIPSLRGWRFTQAGFYFMDTYRIHRDVTLNYGVRYEFNTPLGEVDGLLNNLFQVDSSGNPLKDKPISDFSQTALFPVCCGAGRDIHKFDKNNLGPRFGLTWNVLGDSKTVLRTGYSIVFGRLFIETLSNNLLNPPFVIGTAIAARPFGSIADPAVDGLTPAIVAVSPDFVNPYTEFWNLNLQREVDVDTVVEIGYVGTRGKHLDYIRQPNFGPGFFGARPNPNFASIEFVESSARSSYDALQLQVKRRFSRGLSYQAAYTWSKCIDDASGTSRGVFAAVGLVTNFPMDQFSRQVNRGVCDYDFRHVFAINYVYELPFGPGKRFLGDTSGFIGKLLEGWTVSGIGTLRSGQAFSILTGSDTNGDGVASDRASVIGNADDLRASSSDPTVWLDQSLVGIKILDDPTLPPSVRNILTGPSTNVWDVAVSKATAIGERYSIEFRSEFFNVFNHTNLGLPDNVSSSPNFGRIFTTGQPSRQIQFALKLYF